MSRSRKKKIEIEEILALNERRREINNYQIDEIVITGPDGKVIPMSDEFVSHWSLTGLNITDLELAFVDGNDQVVMKKSIDMGVWKHTTK